MFLFKKTAHNSDFKKLRVQRKWQVFYIFYIVIKQTKFCQHIKRIEAGRNTYQKKSKLKLNSINEKRNIIYFF